MGGGLENSGTREELQQHRFGDKAGIQLPTLPQPRDV